MFNLRRTRILSLSVILILLGAISVGHGLSGCGGSDAAPAPSPPPAPTLSLATPLAYYYVGIALTIPAPTVNSGTVESYSISPALPNGVTLDPQTGAISGTPVAAYGPVTHTLSVTYGAQSGAAGAPFTSAAGSFTFEVQLLPDGVVDILPGYIIENVRPGLNRPLKFAIAPNNRIFINEQYSGHIWMLETNSWTLLPQPFATLAVSQGGERGLLGIALAPDYATSGHVFVVACVDAPPPKVRVIRYETHPTTGVGINPTVIVDDLPQAPASNSGDIKFLPDGTFVITVGDQGDENLPQSDLSLAGKIHRFNADGSIPADNPDPLSSEYGRGIRNVFGMTVHPVTGGLFAGDNGPAADDRLIFIQPGRNFAWPSAPMNLPPNQTGLIMRVWAEVIAPTGMVFSPNPAFGTVHPGDANNPSRWALLIGSYVEAEVLRFMMSGSSFVDIDSEEVLVRFESGQLRHQPLDLQVLPDGSLLISTFDALWRVR